MPDASDMWAFGETNTSLVDSLTIDSDDIAATANKGVISSQIVWDTSSDPAVAIGILELIKWNEQVRVKFTAEDSITHDTGLYNVDFNVTATDKDGDTDTSSIQIKIKDAKANLEVELLPVLEDAGHSLVVIKVDLADKDGETVQSLKIGPVEGGVFYYLDSESNSYVEITREHECSCRKTGPYSR